MRLRAPDPRGWADLAFSWLVWPGSAEMVLVLVNRDSEADVRLGTVTLTELDDVPPPPPLREPDTPATRTLGLYLTGTHALDPFGGGSDPGDTLATARNLVKYLGYCGASAVVVPEELADRSRRRALEGQADEDSTGPDRLEILRRVLARQGCSLWLELAFDGRAALPGLPPPDSAEAVRRGLVRLDGQGRPGGSAYHPLHPEVREAMKRRVVEALTRSRTAPVAARRGPARLGVGHPAGAGADLAGNPRHRGRRRDLRAVRPRDLQPGDGPEGPGPGYRRPGTIRRAACTTWPVWAGCPG